MTRTATKAKMKLLRAREVEGRIRALLGGCVAPEDLLRNLEELALQPAFSGFTWLYGPELYRRDRIRFRPFLLSHFAEYQFDPPSSFSTVSWDKEKTPVLDAWLEQTDRFDDLELFRRLMQWKMRRAFRSIDSVEICKRLSAKFAAATSAAERGVVAAKFDLWFVLDEVTATELYKIEPAVAGPFILKHLPLKWGWFGGQKRELWKNLYRLAEARNDQELVLNLYRRQIPLEIWAKDVLALTHQISDPGALRDVLEERHPQGFGLDTGPTFLSLLEQRGRDVLSYVMRHLREVRTGIWFRSGYDALLDFARKREWWDFWGTLVRTCSSPKQFNKEINALVADQRLSEQDVRHRLMVLAGVSQECNFPGFGMALVKPLEDDVAVRFYKRFPDLVRGPFKLHPVFTWGLTYPHFLEMVLKNPDDVLIDYLASRAITRGGRYERPEMKLPIEMLATYYLSLREDSPEFARRATTVLGQIPAFTIYDYKNLITSNRLARLFFERSATFYLGDGFAIRNLVEASEIHVQLLAYKILGLEDERARACARENLDITLGTFLRPLHRKTRIAAFHAIYNACADTEIAGRVLRKAREAMDLPDKRYPKEDLLLFIGKLLHAWPELRLQAEVPHVFNGQTRKTPYIHALSPASGDPVIHTLRPGGDIA
ncbi:MAG: gliding motility protein [Candidatus Ozemobacteraceae bacterium]